MATKIKFILYTLGPAFLLFSIFSFYSVYYKTTNYSYVTGTVARTIKNGTGKGSYYYPEIQFTANNQQLVVFDYYTYPPSFLVTGDSVTVFYNPENPNDVTVYDFVHLLLVPVISLLIGGAGMLAIVKIRDAEERNKFQTNIAQ